MVKVIVRDGRAGRDPNLVTVDSGEVLAEIEAERPYRAGERLTLPDGTHVVVIAVRERIVPNQREPVQTVNVGNP